MIRLGALLLVAGVAQAADVQSSRDPASGLETWESDTNGIAVRLTQITPDQAQAFFLARGFPAGAAERYARACVFMSVVRNTGAQPLRYRLAEWRYRAAGGEWQRMKLKEDWLGEWRAQGLPQPALIAFEWSQLPDEQDYAPGDWNQGMTTYALPHGARFDLRFEWESGGRRQTGTMEGIRCAEDRP